MNHLRRTLLQDDTATATATAAGKPLESPATSSTASTSPFDSSLVLTILVLLTALFFMAFFSLYIRRFSSSSASDSISGNRHSPPHFRKHRGVDATTVRSLPTFPYQNDLKKTVTECSICLTEFELSEPVKVIPYCRHGFHPVCIDAWLSSHGSCPLCRSTELFPAVDEKVPELDPTVVTRRD